MVLPAGTEHVQFGELADLIAIALHPFGDNATDREMMAYRGACTNLDAELRQAVNVGTLPVKNPFGLGAHTFPVGDALRRSRVMVDDLRQFVAGRLSVEVAPTAAPAPVGNTSPDITLMATREQLIAAFGSFTGMKAAWFANMKDTPALLAARKVKGQGGRGHIAEPLFCPFEVLQWLTNPTRRKGRKLSIEKGWQLFESHFPRVYAAYSVGDPRPD